MDTDTFCCSSFITSLQANTDTLIWNLEDRRSALQSVLHCHHRPVNDIAWSPFEPHILATCSSDTNVFVWDLRDTRKALKLKTFCAWTVSAWHVRWNRHNPQLLASAHEGEIRLWDLRKEAAPITSITAHMSKITGIDWSYHSEHELLSCSQDKQVKFWNIRTPNVCQQTLQTGTAVARARYTVIHSSLSLSHTHIHTRVQRDIHREELSLIYLLFNCFSAVWSRCDNTRSTR
jgi:WD40 repeat protein